VSRQLFVLGLLMLAVGSASAADSNDTDESMPRVSIIIDDLGNNARLAHRVIALPGPITCAFLPQLPGIAKLAEAAHRSGKQVMLHLPMESMAQNPLGPGGLTMAMDKGMFMAELQRGIASVPHVVGINNHMGSLLTQHPGHMSWLMEGLRQSDLFFLDSRTTTRTVALRIAREQGVPVAKRDVFLDHDRDEKSIRHAFKRLAKRAKTYGSAVGIGHPYPTTLRLLREILPELEQRYGVRLVPVTQQVHYPTSIARKKAVVVEPS